VRGEWGVGEGVVAESGEVLNSKTERGRVKGQKERKKVRGEERILLISRGLLHSGL
jgi:hypothetical protein